MRNLIFAILLFLSVLNSACSQAIVKGSGIIYTDGVPTHTPLPWADAELAIDTANGFWYEYNRDSGTWPHAGFRIQLINDCALPSYTPGDKQSYIVLDTCNNISRYRAGVWSRLGGITGTIADQQIAFGVATVISGSNNLKWNGSGIELTKAAIGGGAQLITNGMVLDNPTAAASLAQQKSPPVVWRGNGWKTTATAASQPVRFIADVLPVQGTSAPSATWRLSSSINGAAFGDRFAVTSGGFAGVGTITPRRTLEVNGNILFTGNVYDNQDNAVMIQSAVGVTSNRDFTFGNSAYGRYLVTFKNFSFSTTGSHPALGNYLYYVNGEVYTSATTPPPIYFKGYQAQAASNTRGSDFIIDLPAGDGTGRRGAVGIGTATVNASAVLDITSTTAGVLFPRMTTAERDLITTPADGLVIFNTTDTKLQVRAGGAWVDLH